MPVRMGGGQCEGWRQENQPGCRCRREVEAAAQALNAGVVVRAVGPCWIGLAVHGVYAGNGGNRATNQRKERPVNSFCQALTVIVNDDSMASASTLIPAWISSGVWLAKPRRKCVPGRRLPKL